MTKLQVILVAHSNAIEHLLFCQIATAKILADHLVELPDDVRDVLNNMQQITKESYHYIKEISDMISNHSDDQPF